MDLYYNNQKICLQMNENRLNYVPLYERGHGEAEGIFNITLKNPHPDKSGSSFQKGAQSKKPP